jgi:uncharacterized CHY-type Zn-finger protein
MAPSFRDVSTVISLLPVTLRETKPGLNPSNYTIVGVKDPKKDVSTLLIARATFPVYIDENRPALIVPEPSDRVAEALCRDYKVSVSHFEPQVAEPGLFWVKDEVKEYELIKGTAPKEVMEELEHYRHLQLEWFRRLVTAADDDWSQYKMRKMISDIQRKAAEILGLEREWNLHGEIREALSVCKFCFNQVNPDAIVCGSCQGILNMDRYKKEFVKAGTTA